MKREVAIKILLEMFFGKASDLYESLYNRGLINASFGFDYTLEPQYAYSMFGGESPKPELVNTEIFSAIEENRKKGLNRANFERIQKMMKGRFVRGLNSVEKVCRGFLSAYFGGSNVFDYYEVYDTIDFAYAEQVFVEHFDPQRLSLSVIRPQKG